jgi:hypothetical protein
MGSSGARILRLAPVGRNSVVKRAANLFGAWYEDALWSDFRIKLQLVVDDRELPSHKPPTFDGP